MAFHNPITERVDNAAKTFLAAAGLSLTDADHIHRGFSKDAKTGNNIVCIADEATPEENFDGNWSVRLHLEVTSNADDSTEDEHEQRFGEACSYFFTATIAADLSAAIDDFTVYFVVPGRQAKRIDGRKWISTAEFTVKCCGTSGR